MIDRFEVGSAPTISASWYADEALADPGSTTVTVHRADGTELVAETAASGSGAAARTLALTTSETGRVDRLRAVWDATNLGTKTTWHEIVGGFYVELAEIRALRNLDSSSKFTTAELKAARTWFETLAEDWCGVAFVPRYSLTASTVDRTRRLFVAWPEVREIYSVTDVDGDAITHTAWKIGLHGEIESHGLSAGSRAVVGYEHGYDYPDGELREAAITAIRSKLLSDQSGRPSRQTLVSNELGTVRLAQPGKTAATGIPEVDRVLNDRIYGPGLIV